MFKNEQQLVQYTCNKVLHLFINGDPNISTAIRTAKTVMTPLRLEYPVERFKKHTMSRIFLWSLMQIQVSEIQFSE